MREKYYYVETIGEFKLYSIIFQFNKAQNAVDENQLESFKKEYGLGD